MNLTRTALSVIFLCRQANGYIISKKRAHTRAMYGVYGIPTLPPSFPPSHFPFTPAHTHTHTHTQTHSSTLTHTHTPNTLDRQICFDVVKSHLCSMECFHVERVPLVFHWMAPTDSAYQLFKLLVVI